ncbi:MAG: FUSC family protein [Sarcina sp.]
MIKINKNKFLYNNILFLISILTYISFKFFFGTKNTFVGITVLQSAFLLLNYDLTGAISSMTFKFISINLYIGIFSYIASINLFASPFINFLAIFILAYALTYDLKTSISYPFVFGYIFLLMHPVTLNEIPLRLLSLIVGAFFIIALQLIFNRKKSRKIIRLNLIALATDTNEKIKLIINDKFKKKEVSSLNKNIDIIIKTIYEKRNNYFHLNTKDRIILNIALYFERLKFDLDELLHSKADDNYKFFLIDLTNIIKSIPDSISDEVSIQKLSNDLYKIISKYSPYTKNNYSFYEMLQNLKTLKFSVCEKNQFINDKKINIPNKFQFDNIFSFKFLSFNSVRFSYALRVSLLISISFFITEYLGFKEGKWLSLTIFPLIQPYSELSNRKIPVKFKGTLIGILIFSIIIFLLPVPKYQLILFLIFYYLYIILSESTFRASLLTATVLGLVSFGDLDPKTAVLQRLIFISLGIIIGYLATKFILPFTLKDSLKKFTKNHYLLTKDIIYDGFKFPHDKILITDLNDKLFISKLIENKILSNNSVLNSTVIKKFIYNQRILNNEIYFLFFSLYKTPHDQEIIQNLRENIKLSFTRHSYNYYIEKDLIHDIKNIEKTSLIKLKTNEERLLFISTYKIIKRFEISNNLLIAINKLLKEEED